jgi:hypothetical protein
MARIYENSLCTVISPSSDPTKPLFIEREASLVSPAVLQLSPDNGGPSATVRFHPVLPKWRDKSWGGPGRMGESGLQKSQPTRRRAWCLQEYELSCRTITFTTHQFVWICREMQCSEADFSNLSRPLQSAANQGNLASGGDLVWPHEQLLWWPFGLFGRAERLSSLREPQHRPENKAWEVSIYNREFMEPLRLYQKWEKLVEEFTSRHITYSTDRLPALSGLAAKRQQETNDKYLAGLWKSDLKNELLWRVEDPERSFRLAEPYNTPTWSWATVSGAVQFPRRPFDLRMYESRMPSPTGPEFVIIDAGVEVIGENPFGRVKSGHITAQGRLLRASLGTVDPSLSVGSHRHNNGWKLHAPNGHDLGSIVFDDRKFHTKHWSLECLWLDPGIVEDADLEPEPERYTGGFGLALSPQTDTEHEAVYIRVGFVQFSPWVFKQIGSVQKSQFTIV